MRRSGDYLNAQLTSYCRGVVDRLRVAVRTITDRCQNFSSGSKMPDGTA
jgi:hypothetical protein